MLTTASTRRRYTSTKLLGLVIALVCGVAPIDMSDVARAAEPSDSDSCELNIELGTLSPSPDFVPLALASFPTLQPIDATVTYSSLNPAYSGLVISGTQSGFTPVYAGSTTVSGGHLDLGTLFTPADPTGSSLTLSGSGFLAGNTTAINTPVTITPYESEPAGTVISVYVNNLNIQLVGGSQTYFDLSKILALNGGTFTLVGVNSGGPADGSVPEPAIGFTISIGLIALSLRRK